ncbi:hypothetical protein [Staphylospora marina]|uniref:hypothetical protein n=1 Tax=Staphylospora marina TaxID=2490858 RepID=UPI0013DE37B9|nr:hypothetical protein [Staphylospora marina]
MSVVKSVVKKAYRGALFLGFLSILLLVTVLLLAFLANPEAMYEAVKKIFGIT